MKNFFASSHQSMFETFYLQTIFNSPVFILKKRITLNSHFWVVFEKDWIYIIKRNKITKDNLGFFEDILKY
jgi:1-acyl-sn-glycerol-3-phosphate acyltransferase